MPIKKIATWAIIIFIAYYLVTRPTGAANAMQHLFGALKSVGSSLATFLNNV